MPTRKPLAKKPAAKSKSPRSRSSLGKLSRNKGKAFEQLVARELRGIFGDQVKRGWQARQGSDAPDVEGVPGWWLEAKHHQKVSIRAAFDQVLAAQADALRKKDPRAKLKALVITKDDRAEPLATVRFEDFVELLRCEKAVELVNAGKSPGDVSYADTAEIARVMSNLELAGIETHFGATKGEPNALERTDPSEGVRLLVEEVLRLRASSAGSLALAQPPIAIARFEGPPVRDLRNVDLRAAVASGEAKPLADGGFELKLPPK